GARLKSEALLWRIGSGELAGQALGGSPRFRPRGVDWSPETLAALPGLSIHDLMLLPVERSHEFFRELTLPRPLDEATALLLAELRTRLAYLVDVGLGYLTLDRQSRTLSGGEVQRINLTTALGTSPEIRASSGSLTGQYLAGRRMVAPRIAPALDRARTAGAPAAEAAGGGVVAVARSNRWLELKGAAEHNLKNIDVRIPLKRLVCVTGVSGSGKSTLVEDVLYPALLKYRGRPTEAPGRFAGLSGAELIDDVVMVDQSPIG